MSLTTSWAKPPEHYTWKIINDPKTILPSVPADPVYSYNLSGISASVPSYQTLDLAHADYVGTLQKIIDDLNSNPAESIDDCAVCKFMCRLIIPAKLARASPETIQSIEKFVQKLIKKNKGEWELKGKSREQSDAILSLLFFESLSQRNDIIGSLLLKNIRHLIPYKFLEEKYSSYLQDYYKGSAPETEHLLHTASNHSLPKIVGALIDKGFDPNRFDGQECTPLFYPSHMYRAGLQKQFEVIHTLLAKGADPYRCTPSGNAAFLFESTEFTDQQKVELLHACQVPLKINKKVRTLYMYEGKSTLLACAVFLKHYAFAAELIVRGAKYTSKRHQQKKIFQKYDKETYLTPEQRMALLPYLMVNPKFSADRMNLFINDLQLTERQSIVAEYCKSNDHNEGIMRFTMKYLQGLGLLDAANVLHSLLLKGDPKDLAWLSTASQPPLMQILAPFFANGSSEEAQSAIFYLLIREGIDLTHLFPLLRRIPRLIPLVSLQTKFPGTYAVDSNFIDVLFESFDFTKQQFVKDLIQKGATFDLNMQHALNLLRKHPFSQKERDSVLDLYRTSVSTLTLANANILIDELIMQEEAECLAAFLKSTSRFSKRRKIVEKILRDESMARRVLMHLNEQEVISLMTLWHHKGTMLRNYPSLQSVFDFYCYDKEIYFFKTRFPKLSTNEKDYQFVLSWLQKPKYTESASGSVDEYEKRVNGLYHEVMTLWHALTWKEKPEDKGLETSLLEIVKISDYGRAFKQTVESRMHTPQEINEKIQKLFNRMKVRNVSRRQHPGSGKEHEALCLMEHDSLVGDLEAIVHELKKTNCPEGTAKHLINILEIMDYEIDICKQRAGICHLKQKLEPQPRELHSLVEHAARSTLHNMIWVSINYIYGFLHDTLAYHYAFGLTRAPAQCSSSCRRLNEDIKSLKYFNITHFINFFENLVPPDTAIEWLKSTVPSYYGEKLLQMQSQLAFWEKKLQRKMKADPYRQKDWANELLKLAQKASVKIPEFVFNPEVHKLPSIACDQLRRADFLKNITEDPRSIYFALMLQLGIITRSQDQCH